MPLHRPRLRALVLTASALTVLAASLAACAGSPPPGPARDAGTWEGAADSSSASASPAPRTAGPPNIPVRDATVVPQLASATSAPGRVRAASYGLDLPVVGVGVADDGQMEVPPDPATAGWYHFGPSPGDDEGSAVIAAPVGE